jgi:hypothetical protein
VLRARSGIVVARPNGSRPSSLESAAARAPGSAAILRTAAHRFAMTPASEQALRRLRDASGFEWHVVVLLAFVIYVYAAEVERKNWHAVVTGLTLWGGEFLWEMVNALVLTATGRAALWTTPGRTGYRIFVGLNIEISLMFAVAPIVLLKLLPAERDRRLFGLPNRVVIPVAFGLFCVLVEVVLNRAGALVWTYAFWRFPHVYLIVLAYTVPFLAVARFNDRVSLRAKVRWLAAIWTATAIAFVVLGPGLHWV